MAAAPKIIDAHGPLTHAKRRVNPWVIAAVVSLAAFMEVLDTSIANVALPYMAGGLAVSVDDASWVLTSYLVANAVVLPITGWLSIRFGRKRFYMACVVIFTVSSFLCGIAPSLGMLILFRILAGNRRRRLATGIAGHLAGHFSARTIGYRVCDVWDGGCGGAGDRADDRRLDNG